MRALDSSELVVDGRTRVPVERAVTVRARLVGLLGRRGVDGALWLEPCRSVHTLGMRFAVDVAHVGADGVVIATATMPAWRVGRARRGARVVVEAASGRFGEWGLRPGSRLALER